VRNIDGHGVYAHIELSNNLSINRMRHYGNLYPVATNDGIIVHPCSPRTYELTPVMVHGCLSRVVVPALPHSA